MFSFNRLTLARQYIVVSFLVMLVGMAFIGMWVSRQIETAVTNRTAAVTALYVDSYISPYLQGVADNQLPAADLAELEQLLTDTSLGQQIVSFKVWAPDGTIIYSPHAELVGQTYPIEGGLAQAFAGDVITEVSNLDKPEQAYERQFWDRLIETYAPSRAVGRDEIIAVSEFYQTTDGLEAEIRRAQYQSWLVVGGAMTAVYLLLAGLVGRASRMIVSQQSALEETVVQQRNLLAQNKKLNERVRRAASRTTALNEQYLRRISADLHDGPAQDLALALLRMDAVSETVSRQTPEVARDFKIVQTAVSSAMKEVRSVSAGLRLPEITPLTISETVRRAVHDYEKKTGQEVVVALAALPEQASLPVKITLFRLIQETLSNGYRHAPGSQQTVHIFAEASTLTIEISDNGPGFDPNMDTKEENLGLVGMRERVELLSGQFDIKSRPGFGTSVQAQFPLDDEEIS
ncbi:MAG: sensor histidine kinase [Anaerolineales bacterium]|nr:sensor histidine kinase [Anaerolineales bacterium]